MFPHQIAAVNSIRNLTTFCADPGDGTPRVGVASPGPPGVGKSWAALDMMIDAGVGRIMEPNHEQARERRAEAHVIIKNKPAPATGPVTTRHVEGLGRKCLYLKGDEWAGAGWGFGNVTCSGCPDKQVCPGVRQHWSEPDVTIGVHSMADWRRPGVLVIDELPNTVKTVVFHEDELSKYGLRLWHPLLEGWRRAIDKDWNALFDELNDLVRDLDYVSELGVSIPLTGLWPLGHPVRMAVERMLVHLDQNPMPKPPGEAVRRGAITPKYWMPGNLDKLLTALLLEVDGVRICDREKLGTVAGLCLRAFGDNEGNVTYWQLELNERWTPPNENHLILDSTAGISGPLYSKLYANYNRQEDIQEVPLDPTAVFLYNYPSLGFSKKRSLNGKRLLRAGADARTRAILKTITRALEVVPPNTRPRIGLIDHKTVLEAMGFDFSAASVVTERVRAATNPRLDAMLEELERLCDIVVGYHHGVTGSNKFQNVHVLAYIDDPRPNIGRAVEEARVTGVDPRWYTTWMAQKAAIQEVYRARLLDTTPVDPKTVLYFGMEPPTLPGATWTVIPWTEGGQLPSPAHVAFELGFAAHHGAFYAALSPDVARLHATPYEGALQALRVSGETIEDFAPRTREVYRRAAAEVAGARGYARFEFPHPQPQRRPLGVWARNLEDAEVLIGELRTRMGSVPIWERPALEQEAVTVEAVELTADAVQVEVADVREEVTSLLRARNLVLQRMLFNPDDPATYDDIVRAVHRRFRPALQQVLVRWRAVRKLWTTPTPSGVRLKC